MSAFTVRTAAAYDAGELAWLQDRTWRQAYGELLPEPALSTGTPEQRVHRWRSRLSTLAMMSGVDECIFIAELGKVPIGFAWGGLGRGRGGLAPDAEIYMLYVLAEQQRSGVGSALLSASARALAARGLFSLTIWTLADNAPARAFYAAHGGRMVGEGQEQVRGCVTEVVAYMWDDIGALIAAADKASGR